MRRLRPTTRSLRPTRPQAADDDSMVLYVEDNPENWEVTRLHLERRFRLLWARDDAEACRLISDHHPVLSTILMDIELKGSALDGIQLTRLVRGQLARPGLPDYASTVPVVTTPIFFVTAHSARYTEAELSAAGGNRLITKPVNFAELSEALTKVQLRAMDTEPARALLRAAHDDATVATLRALLDENAGLEARLLRLLGSGVLGTAAPSDSFAAAFAELGPEGLRPMALALAVVDLVPPGRAGEALFANALRRAVAARLLAERTGQAPPELGFALGLLLDAGLIARAQHDATGAMEVVRGPASSRVIREKAAGDLEHPTRGAQIAREWTLGDAIRDAVEGHHAAEPPADAVARVGWLAERLAGVFETGDVRLNRSAAIRAADQIGLDEAQVAEILDAIPDALAEAGAALGREVPRQAPIARLLEEANPSLSELHDSYLTLVGTLAALVEQKDALTARLRQAKDRLAEKAATDPLTGLANRRAFDAALERELIAAARAQQPISLIMADLDHFKAVNDRAGHLVGDEVLRAAAAAVRRHLRSDDFASRYGGEELAVILPNTGLEDARQVAERVRIGFHEDPFLRAVEGSPVTSSFGVASLEPSELAAGGEALITAADAALYVAKREGRDRVAVAGG